MQQRSQRQRGYLTRHQSDEIVCQHRNAAFRLLKEQKFRRRRHRSAVFPQRTILQPEGRVPVLPYCTAR